MQSLCRQSQTNLGCVSKIKEERNLRDTKWIWKCAFILQNHCGLPLEFYLQPLATFFFGETTKFLDVTCGVDGAIQHQNLHEKAKKNGDSKNIKRKTFFLELLCPNLMLLRRHISDVTISHRELEFLKLFDPHIMPKEVSAVTLVILMVWASTPWLDFSKVNVNFAHCMTLIMKTLGPNFNSSSTSTQSSYTFLGWHNYWQNIDIMIVRMM